MTNTRLIAAALAVAFPGPLAALAQSRSCAATQQMVADALPAEAGDAEAVARLLRPAAATDATRPLFDPCAALSGVDASCTRIVRMECDDRCPGNLGAGADGRCTFRLPDGAVLKTRADEGRFKYLNPSRTFDPRPGVPNAVPKERAVAAALRAAEAFGVPSSEIDPREVRAGDVFLYSGGDEKEAVSKLRAEIQVRIGRQFRGTPVYGSAFQSAVDARAQVARAHMNWPAFRFAPGLDARFTLPRADVARRVLERLTQPDGSCLPLEAVRAYVAYARTDMLGEGDSDGDGSGRTPVYAPSLVLISEPKFDPAAHQYGTALEAFVVPLVTGEPDLGATGGGEGDL